METLGAKLQALRRAANRNVKEVTDALGLGEGHLAAIESGRIPNPGIAVVCGLAAYYGVDVGELVTPQRKLALSPTTSAVLRIFEEELSEEERQLLLRMIQAFIEHRTKTAQASRNAAG